MKAGPNMKAEKHRRAQDKGVAFLPEWAELAEWAMELRRIEKTA